MNFKTVLIMPAVKNGFKITTVPLNLAYLGAILKNNNFDVKGLNLEFDRLSRKLIKNTQLFGISATSPVMAEAVKIARLIKKINPSSFIVLGGPHATALKAEILKRYPCFDAVIYGEGEVPILALAKQLSSKGSLEKVPNLIYRRKNRIFTTKLTYDTKELDRLPFPDKSIFNTSKYPNIIQAYGDIVASRGCPFQCQNCKPGLDHVSKYRLREVKGVVDELECLHKQYKVKHFSFSDSELAGPKKWVMSLCQEIIKRNIKITFSCNGRTDQVDEEVVRMLKKAGCVFIGYGIESGSQRVIDDILKKGINLKVAKKIIQMTVKNGIGVGTWFMIGIPGETREDIKKTVEYAKSIDALTVEVNIATPWPDTGFYNICQKNKWLLSSDFSEFNEKNTTIINTPFLTADEVKSALINFKKEMHSSGWCVDDLSNRMYHPRFLFKTIRLNYFQLMRRGLGISDFKRFIGFAKIAFSG